MFIKYIHCYFKPSWHLPIIQAAPLKVTPKSSFLVGMLNCIDSSSRVSLFETRKYLNGFSEPRKCVSLISWYRLSAQSIAQSWRTSKQSEMCQLDLATRRMSNFLESSNFLGTNLITTKLSWSWMFQLHVYFCQHDWLIAHYCLN